MGVVLKSFTLKMAFLIPKSIYPSKNGLKNYSQQVLNKYLRVFGTFMKESQPCSVFHKDMLPLKRGIDVKSLFTTLLKDVDKA